MFSFMLSKKERVLCFVFQINRFRNQHKINIQGTDLPDPIATFEQLQKEYKIHPKIMENIQAAGFQVPTPIQMQAIPVMLHVGFLPLHFITGRMAKFGEWPLPLGSQQWLVAQLQRYMNCIRVQNLAIAVFLVCAFTNVFWLCSVNIYVNVGVFSSFFLVKYNTLVFITGSGTSSFSSYWVWKNTGILYSSLNASEATQEQRIQGSDHITYPRTCQPGVS